MVKYKKSIKVKIAHTYTDTKQIDSKNNKKEMDRKSLNIKVCQGIENAYNIFYDLILFFFSMI